MRNLRLVPKGSGIPAILLRILSFNAESRGCLPYAAMSTLMETVAATYKFVPNNGSSLSTISDNEFIAFVKTLAPDLSEHLKDILTKCTVKMVIRYKLHLFPSTSMASWARNEGSIVYLLLHPLYLLLSTCIMPPPATVSTEILKSACLVKGGEFVCLKGKKGAKHSVGFKI